MFLDPRPFSHLLLISLSVVLGLSLCMQTTAFNVRKGNSPVVEVQCMEKERQALLNFKKGLLDPSQLLSSWVEEVNCCQWRGVQCNNRTGHVVALDLHNPYEDFDTSLGGEISYSLLDLQYLQRLDLSFNDFSFNPIPEFFGSLVQLRSLNLSNAYFGGQIPHQIGNLSNLNYLDLSCPDCLISNNLDWLSRLSSLIYLDMSGTNLSHLSNFFNNPYSLSSLQHLRLSRCGLHEISSSSYLKPLENATSLAHLDLMFNNLKDPIPDFLGNITSLTYLDLSFNDLEGGIPSSWGKLCNLQTLRLRKNNLSENIADEFWSGCISNSLKEMDLSSNKLYGHLPEDLGRFSSLRKLHLNGNRLNGSLPSSIGQLTNLVSLDVFSNSLEGVISETHLSCLSKLRVLRLSSNSFKLNLRFDWTPPFQLKTAKFGSCQLGPQFPLWLRTQKNILSLDISNNGINDTIPTWFWNVSSSMDSMDLSSNLIYGKLPTLSLALLEKTSEIDLSSNLIEGSVPRISPSTQILKLSNNSFSGTLSNLLCNISSIPNSLLVLDLSRNQLVGPIPDCLNYWQDVLSLHFNGNNLSGVLPFSLRNCTSLVVIDAGENRFTGEIPPWIGENLAHLKILRLHSNGFTGNIPLQLCQSTGLQILDLASNNLQGIVPHCLHNITAMSNFEPLPSIFNNVIMEPFDSEKNMVVWKGLKLVKLVAWKGMKLVVVWKGMKLEYKNREILLVKSIDFSSNNLSGEIPREMMNLLGLCSLNLSRNSLFGKIPNNIGNLSNLESLDFSRNHLSGFLPIGLANLSFLSYLDLSFNNFRGTIPTGTQLQSFNVSSYMGNLGLCGPPLSVNCTRNATSSQDNHPTKNEDGIDIPWFYIGIAMGYIIGFWVVCGVLLFKQSWRNAYFRFIEEVHDWLYAVLVFKARKLQRKFGNL